MNNGLGRNDVCSCGSGKKYKRCCGAFDAHTAFNTAMELLNSGFYNRAEELFRQILKSGSILQNKGMLYNLLGMSLNAQSKIQEAKHAFQRSIEENSNDISPYVNLGGILRSEKNFKAAESLLKKALKIQKNEHIYATLGGVYFHEGKIEDAISARKQAVLIDPNNFVYYSNYLYMLNFSEKINPSAIFNEHKRFGEHISNIVGSVVDHTNHDYNPNRRVRIGYLSPDFRNHAVSYFIEPVLTRHSKSDFEIFCYSDVPNPDETTIRLHNSVDVWRNISGLSNQQVSDLIMTDDIDILVDVTGHTGRNRMALYAKKPAPLQITWFGYANTTGLKKMDYLISDNYIAPGDSIDNLFTEKLLKLPNCFVCYIPPKDSPKVGFLPFLNNNYITLGSFNNLAKINDEVIKLWSNILSRIPNSRLSLRFSNLANETTKNEIEHRFQKYGIDPMRLDLGSRSSTIETMEDYNNVDISLDTFPFNGTTTICESLWMGVPVVTLAGNSHVSRVGTSLISNVGMSDLVAKNYDEYINIVIELSTDIERLTKIRADLRSKFSATLGNSTRFTMELENALREVWREKCNNMS